MGFDADQLVTEVIVYPDPGVDTETLASAIEHSVEQVRAVTGADFNEQIASARARFNAIVIGIALISLVEGGLWSHRHHGDERRRTHA